MNSRATLLAAAALAMQTAACSINAPAPMPGAGAPMAAAAPAPAERGPYLDVTIPQYRTMSETADFFVVNVHVPFEGNLPDTDATIAFDQIQNQLDKLPKEKDARILLYCKSGRMSVIAAQALAKEGYTNVYNLAGGMNAWTAAGHALLGV